MMFFVVIQRLVRLSQDTRVKTQESRVKTQDSRVKTQESRVKTHSRVKSRNPHRQYE